MNLEKVLGRLKIKDGSESRGQWNAHCPAHDDSKASLSITIGNKGLLLKCHSPCNCPTLKILQSISCTWDDIFLEKRTMSNQQQQTKAPMKVSKVYDYRNDSGKMVFQVVRLDPKDFRQRRPNLQYDPRKGSNNKENPEFFWNLDGVDKVLYKLPELLEAIKKFPERWIMVLEGEKDVDLAWANQFVATCNPGGALKWEKQYSEVLRGCNVIVIPDDDPVDSRTGFSPGHKHAREVCESLKGIANKVVYLELPTGVPHGDFSDWFLGLSARGIEKLEDKKVEFTKLLREAVEKNERANTNNTNATPVPSGKPAETSTDSKGSATQEQRKEPEKQSVHPDNAKAQESAQFGQALEIMHVVTQLKALRDRKHPPIPTVYDLLGRVDTELDGLKTVLRQRNTTALHQARESLIQAAALIVMGLEDVPGLRSESRQ